MSYKPVKDYNPISETERRVQAAHSHLDPEYWRDGPGTAMVRRQQNNFVAPVPQRQQLPAQSAHTMTLDVTPSSTAVIDVRTSHVDRAKGYLLSTVPLCFALALIIVGVRACVSIAPVWSLATLVWLWTSFGLFWLISYVLGYVIQSPEFVMLFEARGKLRLLEREQVERWKYYNQEVKRNG